MLSHPKGFPNGKGISSANYFEYFGKCDKVEDAGGPSWFVALENPRARD